MFDEWEDLHGTREERLSYARGAVFVGACFAFVWLVWYFVR